jgi:hypothetical protein
VGGRVPIDHRIEGGRGMGMAMSAVDGRAWRRRVRRVVEATVFKTLT